MALKDKMKAEELLGEIRNIEQGIRNKKHEVARWKMIAKGVGTASEGERVQTSGDKERMAKAVTIYADIQADIVKEIDRLYELERYITHIIEGLPAIEYDLLHKKYIGIPREDKTGQMFIKYMSLKEIAELYGKSESWAEKKHRNAIRKVQGIIDKSEST